VNGGVSGVREVQPWVKDSHVSYIEQRQIGWPRRDRRRAFAFPGLALRAGLAGLPSSNPT
jgi:hypothetical protein